VVENAAIQIETLNIPENKLITDFNPENKLITDFNPENKLISDFNRLNWKLSYELNFMHRKPKTELDQSLFRKFEKDFKIFRIKP